MIDERLKDFGITLPEPVRPLGFYLPALRAGNLLFLSGILPLKDGKLSKTGKVGKDLTLEEAQDEAKTIVINALSIIKEAIGGLDNIKRCVRLTGYVASPTDFTDQPKVLNAASELLFNIFGENGKHTRVAVGVSVLPLNSPVEIDFIFEVIG